MFLVTLSFPEFIPFDFTAEMYVETAICLQLPFIVKCKPPVGLTLQAGVAFRTLPSGILIRTWCNSVFAHTKNTTRTNNSKVYYLSGANFWFDVITEALFFLFPKKLEDISPFCGATDTPVLDFWWHPAWVSKPGWVPLLACFVACVSWIPQIHLW